MLGKKYLATNRPHKLHQQKNRWHNAGIRRWRRVGGTLLLMLTPATQPALLDSVVSEHVRSLQADHCSMSFQPISTR